ncbi:MAG: 2-oxoacid:acceptor oxidoreductase subunit alpha [Halobacteriales archaeon]
MTENDLVWRVAGGSGDGIDSTGSNFTTALMRAGLNVTTHRHYPSRIRGGHTYFEVRASNDEIKARADEYNVLLALGDSFGRAPDDQAVYGNEEIKPLTENLDDLAEGGAIIYDSGVIDVEDLPDFQERVDENGWHVYDVNLREIAKEQGREVMRNTAGVGATCAAVGIPLDLIEDVMSDSMSGEILEANVDILHHTHDLVEEEYDHEPDVSLPEGTAEGDHVLLSGSHAIAYGALDSGCRFISGYPMTPWTDVFAIMSSNMPEFDGVSEQVEDEIAAASMAIGASHAGAKAMSGSSGGGFALMSEPLGMAEATETPVVLVEAMRGGPSTGLPTKTEQSDLEHVLYTSQGDALRVVLAPGDVEEAYEQTRLAFEIAYDYNMPAVVLYDKDLGGNLASVPADALDVDPNPDSGAVLTEEEIQDLKPEGDQDFKRFDLDAERGVPPRPIPGQKDGRFKTSGNEHDEYGYISEDPVNRTRQMDRRLKRFDFVRERLDEAGNQAFYGDEDADVGLLCFGSTKNVVEESVDRLRDDGRSASSLNVSDLVPFAHEEVESYVESVEDVYVVENNATAQFRHHVQRELGGYGDELTSVLKYDGKPFRVAEVVDAVESAIEGDEPDMKYNTRLQTEVSRKGRQLARGD